MSKGGGHQNANNIIKNITSDANPSLQEVQHLEKNS